MNTVNAVKVNPVNGCGVKPLRRTDCVRGFSLIELMVAMTILGFGLVMVATVFPIALGRARDLSEVTTQVAVTDAAEMTVRLLVHNSGLDPTDNASSFAGDVIYDDGFPSSKLYAKPDAGPPRVHALYMENLLVSPRAYTPDWENPQLSEGAPWELELMPVTEQFSVHPDMLPAGHYFLTVGFGSPQVRLGDRVYPPIRRRNRDSVDANGVFRLSVPDDQWDDALDTRRYAWAVFHRLTEPEFDMDATAEQWAAAAEDERVFDIYYVTLRRARSNLRFAQQDPDPDKAPVPVFDASGTSGQRGDLHVPEALPPANDVAFPVPWRVQVEFPDTLALEGDDTNPPTGAPTEIEVEYPGEAWILDMFTPGTPLIDEVSGNVYRIAKRRIVGANDDRAVLTLDDEVLINDVDDGRWDSIDTVNHYDSDTLDDDELIRTVWVFPPPVEATRLSGGEPVFNGKQPVVGITIRSLTVVPR